MENFLLTAFINVFLTLVLCSILLFGLFPSCDIYILYIFWNLNKYKYSTGSKDEKIIYVY